MHLRSLFARFFLLASFLLAGSWAFRALETGRVEAHEDDSLAVATTSELAEEGDDWGDVEAMPVVGMWIKTVQCSSSRWSATKPLSHELLLNPERRVRVRYIVCGCELLNTAAGMAKWLGMTTLQFDAVKDRVELVDEAWCRRFYADERLKGMVNPSIYWKYRRSDAEELPIGEILRLSKSQFVLGSVWQLGQKVSLVAKDKEIGWTPLCDTAAAAVSWRIVADALRGLSLIFAESLYTFNFLPPVARHMPAPEEHLRLPGFETWNGLPVIFRQPGALIDTRMADEVDTGELYRLLKSGMTKPDVAHGDARGRQRSTFLGQVGNMLMRYLKTFDQMPSWLQKEDYHVSTFYFHDQPPGLVLPQHRVENILIYGDAAQSWTTRRAGLQPNMPGAEDIVMELVGQLTMPALQRAASREASLPAQSLPKACARIIYVGLGGEGFRVDEDPQNFPGQHAATIVNLLRVLSSRALSDYCFLWGAGGTLTFDSPQVKEMVLYANELVAAPSVADGDCTLQEVAAELNSFAQAHDKGEPWEYWIPFQNGAGTCLPNTVIGHRLPQAAILASGKVDAFISHLGCNSRDEALGYAVPLLGVPNALTDGAASLWSLIQQGAALDLQPFLRPCPYTPTYARAQNLITAYQAGGNKGAFMFSMEQLSANFPRAVGYLKALFAGYKVPVGIASSRTARSRPPQELPTLSLDDLKKNAIINILTKESGEPSISLSSTVTMLLDPNFVVRGPGYYAIEDVD